MSQKLFALLHLWFAGIMFTLDFLLFGQLGIYIDEQGISPIEVWGSDFWNLMNWLLFFMLFFNLVLSVINYTKIAQKNSD